MTAEAVCGDQRIEIGEATKVDGQSDTGIERGEPPCLGGSHRHAGHAEPLRIHFGAGCEVREGPEFVEHHHAPEHLAAPEHELEGVFLSAVAVGVVLALTKTPAVDGQRDHSHFSEDGSIGGLNAGPFEQLFLAQTVHSRVPVNEEKAGRLAL